MNESGEGPQKDIHDSYTEIRHDLSGGLDSSNAFEGELPSPLQAKADALVEGMKNPDSKGYTGEQIAQLLSTLARSFGRESNAPTTTSEEPSIPATEETPESHE